MTEGGGSIHSSTRGGIPLLTPPRCPPMVVMLVAEQQWCLGVSILPCSYCVIGWKNFTCPTKGISFFLHLNLFTCTTPPILFGRHSQRVYHLFYHQNTTVSLGRHKKRAVSLVILLNMNLFDLFYHNIEPTSPLLPYIS